MGDKDAFFCRWLLYIFRVGQNRIYTPYITVYLKISLPKVPYIHRIYMVLANPIHITYCAKGGGEMHTVAACVERRFHHK